MFEEAKSIEELIKFRPDWSEMALREKHYDLNGDKPFTVGKLPQKLCNEEIFNKLAKELNNTVRRFYGADFHKKEPKDEFNLKIDNKTYNFKLLFKGQSDKRVFS